MLVAETTTVARLRLRHSQVEGPAARLRLSALLSPVALQPQSMPPSAVLIVRSMDDPLPGGIHLDLKFEGGRATAWECAAQRRLDTLYRGAARPALGPVPSSAEAVVYSDYGELLACLALDLGSAGATFWWWRSLLRHSIARSAASFAPLWASHAFYIPGALQRLHLLRQAATVLERMSPAEALGLFVAVQRAFQLPELLPARLPSSAAPYSRDSAADSTRPAFSGEELSKSESPAPEFPFAAGDRPSFAATATEPPPPPWERYIPSEAVPASLGLARRALLGLSLVLARAPQLAADPLFPLLFRKWFAAEQACEDLSRASSPAPPRPGAAPPLRAALAATPSLNSRLGIVFETPAPPVHPATASEIISISPSHSTTAAVPSPTPDAPMARDEVAAPQGFQAENAVRTRLGGVFYLVNLLRQGRFLYLNFSLGGWALLELLARCLLEDDFGSVSSDPVWNALAALDGREVGAAPGTAFVSEAAYEAPDAWLRSLDPALQFIRFRSGRVELWHNEGFLTLDAESPADKDLTHVPRVRPRQHREWSRGARVRPLDLPLAPGLRRLLRFILTFVRWRMSRVLPGVAVADLLRAEGVLYFTRTHVDMVMPMNQINICARLAGLDADPGWVPEMGRVIRFHFADNGSGGLRL